MSNRERREADTLAEAIGKHRRQHPLFYGCDGGYGWSRRCACIAAHTSEFSPPQ